MRTLVAGGSGFIGSHLVRSLLSGGHEVITLGRSNLTLNHLSSDAMRRHTHLISDLTSPLVLNVDAIYNFASPASPMQHKKDPLQTIRTNVMGTWNLLNLAFDLQVPFFQASTSEIYGRATDSAQSENDLGMSDTFGEMASYVESKRLAETLCSEFNSVHKVPVRVARIFSTYGPGMAWGNGRVMSNFISQALSGRPITLYGDGQDKRTFLFIDDLVTGISRMMDSEELKVGPVNLGSTEVITLRGLAEKIIELTNSSSELQFLSSPSYSSQALVPNIELAKELLSWEPQVHLDKGLGIAIESFPKYPKNK